MTARRALLVGIDSYPHLPETRQLAGAVRDVEQMADVLVNRFELRQDDVVVLRDVDATRDRVLERLDGLIEETASEDFLLLYWSGHGSQCPAPVGPSYVDEPDGLAESLVPHDGRAPGEGEDAGPLDILDDEVRRRLARLDRQGAFATLIFDCCHSGHVYRASGPRARWVEVATRRPRLEPGSEDQEVPGRRLRRPLGHRQVVLSACRDDQTASERLVTSWSDGVSWVHGHFSWTLLRELTADDPPATAGEIFRRARSRMLTETRRQTPQFAGADERLLFGTVARSVRPWVRVRGVDLRAEPRPEVEFHAGAAQRIEVGDLWQIHSPGTSRPTSSSRIALAEVHQVNGTASRARIVRDVRRPLVVDSRAYLHRPARGEVRLPVMFVEPDDATTAALDRSPFLRRAGESDGDPVRVHRIPSGGSEGEGRPVRGLGRLVDEVWALCDVVDEPFAVVPVASGVQQLRRRLERRARFRQGLRLDNPDGRTRPDGVELRLLDAPPGDDEGGLPCYRDGDRIRFEVIHRNVAPLYLTVLNFGLDDEICQVFPLPGAEELLDGGRRHQVGVAEDDDTHVFLPEALDSSAAPDWRIDRGVEFLVLFATSDVTDFRILTTERPTVTRGTSTVQSWLNPFGSSTMRSAGDSWCVVRVPYRLASR